MDGLCLLAARLQVRADAVIPNDAKSAPVRSSRGARGDPVKGPQEGRQSEGVWKTAARGSLSRRNGNTTTAPGEARLSRALPNRFSRSGEQSCPLLPRRGGGGRNADSCPESGRSSATVRHAFQSAK